MDLSVKLRVMFRYDILLGILEVPFFIVAFSALRCSSCFSSDSVLFQRRQSDECRCHHQDENREVTTKQYSFDKSLCHVDIFLYP